MHFAVTFGDSGFHHDNLKIERERADLSVQLISLTDRLDDAEGTTDAQVVFTIVYVVRRYTTYISQFLRRSCTL